LRLCKQHQCMTQRKMSFSVQIIRCMKSQRRSKPCKWLVHLRAALSSVVSAPCTAHRPVYTLVPACCHTYNRQQHVSA
jgi:hypothetical protein